MNTASITRARARARFPCEGSLTRCLNYSHFQTMLKHGQEHGHNHLSKSKTKIPSFTRSLLQYLNYSHQQEGAWWPANLNCWNSAASFLCSELCRKTCSHASLCKGDLVQSVLDSSTSHFAFPFGWQNLCILFQIINIR